MHPTVKAQFSMDALISKQKQDEKSALNLKKKEIETAKAELASKKEKLGDVIQELQQLRKDLEMTDPSREFEIEAKSKRITALGNQKKMIEQNKNEIAASVETLYQVFNSTNLYL
jgi:hypothetical protein